MSGGIGIKSAVVSPDLTICTLLTAHCLLLTVYRLPLTAHFRRAEALRSIRSTRPPLGEANAPARSLRPRETSSQCAILERLQFVECQRL